METTLLNRFAAISAANPHWLSPSSCISRCRDNNCIRFCTLSSVAEAAWCTSRSMKFLESNISTAMSIHSNSGLLESSAILLPKSPAILGKVPGVHLCAQGSHNERDDAWLYQCLQDIIQTSLVHYLIFQNTGRASNAMLIT